MRRGKLCEHLVVQPERCFEDKIVSVFCKGKKVQGFFIRIREQQYIRVLHVEPLRVLLDREDFQQFDGPVVKAAVENENLFPETMGGKHIAQRITGLRRGHVRGQVGKIKAAGNKADHDAFCGIVINAWIRQHQLRPTRRACRPEGCQVKDFFRAFRQGEGFKFKLRPAFGAINGFFHQGSFPPEINSELAASDGIPMLLDQPPEVGKAEKHGRCIFARMHAQRHFACEVLIDHDLDLRVFIV